VTRSVEAWLEGLGLGQYAEAFAENDLDFDLLPQLNDALLKDIGVRSAGHRLRLLTAAAALAPAAPPATREAPDGEGDRRHATILMADLSGYTELCRRFDAEAMQALVQRFYGVTDAIVAAFGGRVIDHAGDGTLAAFGAPVAHGNDPERAVRAALEMHRQTAGILDPSGAPLGLHAGIASGEVVCGVLAAAEQRKFVVTGDAVNLAARLSAVALPGQTVIAKSVWRDVRNSVDVEALGEVAVKGAARPVPLWRVHGLREPGFQAGVLVGRRAELQGLLAALQSLLDRRHGAVLCVRGEPGIGKSRLVREMQQHARGRGCPVHRAHVLDFGGQRGQDAVLALLAQALGGEGGAERALAAVARAQANGMIVAGERPFVLDLLDLPMTPEERVAFDAMDPPRRQRGLRDALAAVLSRLAAARPRVLLVEDIHWASPRVLQYLAALARAAAGAPLMLLMTSRVEGCPLDRGWHAQAAGTPMLTIDLGPLTEDEARELAQSLSHASADSMRACVQRAEGNPLFLEQLLRNLAEAQAELIPASIHSLVLARVDRLGAREKQAVQAASVLGKRFGLASLRAVLEDAAYDPAPLVAADLLREDSGELAFAHALIQEGVYASLLNTRKRALHLRAAEALSASDLVLRAEHLDRAGDPRAPAAYFEAAREQAQRFRTDSALGLAERGSALADDAALRTELLLLRGDLLRQAGRSSDSIAAFEVAVQSATSDEQRCKAWMGVVAGHRVTTDVPAAMRALDEAQRIAERLGSADHGSRIHHVRGNLHFARGDGDACRAEHQVALRLAREVANPECEALALSGLGDADYLQARMLRALDHFRGGVELSRQHGLPRTEAANRCMAGHCLFYANRMEDSVQEMQAALRVAQAMGLTQVEIFVYESLGYLLALRGEHHLAEEYLRPAIPLARAAGARRYLSLMLYALALGRMAQGLHAEAQAALDEALDLTRSTGPAFAGPIVHAGIALLAGDAAGATRALADGESLLGQGAVSHCHLHFRRDAIDVSLRWGAPAEALRHAAALEDYVARDPLPWAELVARRGRLLAQAAAGQRHDRLMQALLGVREDLQRSGMRSALPSVDAALQVWPAGRSR
jgi:class 3 adenylate cyclase/tetratricopeptide (TPR) repeat protein